ncbi:HAMP domain-containing protein [Clostridium neonatale]|nr:HAMP domain-containing protein [Clostridium neonatale]
MDLQYKMNNFIVNKNTIKGKILNYNISIIIMLIALTAIIFNLSINLYIQKDIKNQLNTLASNAKNTVLINSPDFFPNNNIPPKPPKFNQHQTNNQDNIETDKNIVSPSDPSENQNNISSHLYSDNNDSFKYYLMLDRSLKEPLTLLNANFILLDENQNTITPLHENFDYSAIIEEISSKNSKAMRLNETTYVNFDFSDNKYMAVIQPIADKDFSFLGWIIIYSNVQKMQELKFYINIILLLILISSAFITVIFSSKLSKNISKPLSDLNEQISSISDRNFGNKIQIPVFDELDELVNNINSMSEKLGDYDKAQKIFLENMSHEFRTPLMSIQS